MSISHASSVAARSALAEALDLDLVGPANAHAFAHELLPEAPSKWYLAGFLVSNEAPAAQRADPEANDEIDGGGEDAGGADDAEQPEKGASRKSFLPSSMGLSVLVQPGTKSLKATVEWGDYMYEGDDEPAPETAQPQAEEGSEAVVPTSGSELAKPAGKKPPRGYRREPRTETVSVLLPTIGSKPTETHVTNSRGLWLVATARAVTASSGLPAGTIAVSVFLVNKRAATDFAYKSNAFQTKLVLETERLFVARPDPRGIGAGNVADEWDERVADLQFRDVFEFAVGHGVSARAVMSTKTDCSRVETVWIPSAEVERVAPAKLSGIELRMEELGALKDAADAEAKLMPLVTQYRTWIGTQKGKLGKVSKRQTDTADEMISEAGLAADRIEAGIKSLSDPNALESFRIANRAMAKAALQREIVIRGRDPKSVAAPSWRPFQLAFILMTLKGVAEPLSHDRGTVDLLFFPTGGGKTEAYLGLAAYAMVLRRLRKDGTIMSAGMSVLMRYTLRLLTLDQLGRATALICALELEREKNEKALGKWRFEIGLWVGSAATPNRMGYRGYDGPGADKTAYLKCRRYNQRSDNPAPIPVENCPWCGTPFEGSGKSFRMWPNETEPLDMRITCVSGMCEFSGDRSLPVVTVDEPLYRRLPAFIIATVDKFAALPWVGQSGALFGRVDRYDGNGFYGPCDPGKGKPLGGPLPPPDLIIQDELHLISGPLGTIAGVYETAIDALASREVNGTVIRPKVIASTATVRRAESQIHALFERHPVTVFPPPGPDRRDSFFAETESSSQTPARLYVGVAAQGRSLKVILLRVSLVLLSAAKAAYDKAGGKKNKDNPADPYMTMLGYFNSLRELGGSRRIIEDEVRTRVAQYRRRRRLDPIDDLFVNRDIAYENVELTSRVSTDKVANAKQRLSQAFNAPGSVDVALATNMISVGLDITRLGLMVVLGQPKTSAEYIQATSRVGRDEKKPGLVITLLNVHKPRDRSHYERFGSYHASFYRSVEATSVTPFAPRALDRALAASLVALCRQSNVSLNPPTGAAQIATHRAALNSIATRFAERAVNHRHFPDPTEKDKFRDHIAARCVDLLDKWVRIAHEYQQNGGTVLEYQREQRGGTAPLLHTFLDPELASKPKLLRLFRANRSMRDVEPSVELDVKVLSEWGN